MKRSSKRLIVLGALLFVAACGPNGCTPPEAGTVYIDYDQLGACNGYQNPNNTFAVSAGPDAAYIAYKVVRVRNDSPAPFNFDPERLYVDEQPPSFVDNDLQFANLIGQLGAAPVTLAPSEDRTLNGYAVAVVHAAGPNPAEYAATTVYPLFYERGADARRFILTRLNSSQTQWPVTESCLQIH